MYYNNSYLGNIYNALNYSLQKQASENYLEKYLEDILLEKQAEEILENYLQEQLLEKQAEEILENYLKEQLLEKQAESSRKGKYGGKYIDQVLKAVKNEGVYAPEPYLSPSRKIKDIKNFGDLDPVLKEYITPDSLWKENLNLRESLQNIRKELGRQKQLYNSLLTKHTGLKEEVDTLRQLNEAITKGLESGAFHANEGLLKTLGRWAKGSWRQGLGGKAKVLGAVGSTALSGFLPFLLDSRKREPQQIPMPQPSGLEGLLGGLNFSDPKTLLLALALAGGLGAGAYGLSRLFG